MPAVVRALQENVKNKSAQKIPEKLYKKSAVQKTPEARIRAGGGPPPSQGPTGAARGESASPGYLVRWGLPSSPPLAYLLPLLRKPSGGAPLHDFPHCSAAGAILILGSLGEAAPAPCKKVDSPSETSPPPCSPPGCAVSSPPWTMGP